MVLRPFFGPVASAGTADPSRAANVAGRPRLCAALGVHLKEVTSCCPTSKSFFKKIFKFSTWRYKNIFIKLISTQYVYYSYWRIWFEPSAICNLHMWQKQWSITFLLQAIRRPGTVCSRLGCWQIHLTNLTNRVLCDVLLRHIFLRWQHGSNYNIDTSAPIDDVLSHFLEEMPVQKGSSHFVSTKNRNWASSSMYHILQSIW